MKQPQLPSSILTVFLLSLAYWFYLAFNTQMIICFDSINYQDLGRLIQNHGFLAYFKNGPNREPLYPFLVSASMAIEQITGLAYVKIMAIFGVLIMFLTQVLTYRILRILNIGTGICVLVLSYFALSPALNNASFSLYSEITALPIILGIIMTSAVAWEAITKNKRQEALIYGALLGMILTLATFVKAAFECITPVYLIIFFACVIASEAKQSFKRITTLLFCLAAAFSFFYVPITGYKWLNLHYNGNFAITNRGSWALYGSTARRMEPLTFKRFAEALAYAPGEGVCNSLFGAQECDFWSYRKSDEFGYAKSNDSSATLINLSTQKALHNPFQYTLLTAIEGLKMFFWESTQIGFVSYPHWLQKIYDTRIFNNGLRFLVSLISLAAVVVVWFQSLRPPSSPIGFLIGLLIFLYISFFSFFFILTRYALPIAPLYLICIGIWLNQKLAPKKIN